MLTAIQKKYIKISGYLISSTFPSGGSISLTITVRAPDSMGQITNTAVVSSDSEDPALANNIASEITDVTLCPIYLLFTRRSP
jgi:hypothetical protein